MDAICIRHLRQELSILLLFFQYIFKRVVVGWPSLLLHPRQLKITLSQAIQISD